MAMRNRIMSKVFIVVLAFFFLAIPAKAQSAHTADQNGDGIFSLSELLRVVQLYQLGSYHCDAAGEDGFNPGTGDQTCLPHSSDYNPQDWIIGFDELLRMIQLYNALRIESCPGAGEDGFCPELPGMIFIPAGNFEMGDPYNEGGSYELPLHNVYLDAYYIGRFEVTNREYVEALNWAYGQGYIQYDDRGYVGSSFNSDLTYTITVDHYQPEYAQIAFDGEVFTVTSRRDYDGLYHLMENHPMGNVSWYGAAAYCNWRSEMEGLTPVYDMISPWGGSDANFDANGYRLPTEAEWERAAAWDGSKHWRYGNGSDDISHATVNYDWYNPLGLITVHSTPVGYYSGVTSPAGCYDMSGNVWEWCYDLVSDSYYATSPSNNPTGPADFYDAQCGRVFRGGGSGNDPVYCRAASRNARPEYYMTPSIGFRISRTY